VRLSVQNHRWMFYVIYILVAWTVAILTVVVLRNLIHSTKGRAIQAIRDDERAAELLGVNLTYYKVIGRRGLRQL
jgi:ABC-type branched-subunit amino acid transport system permease subunit